jgi:hypothetical protein
LPIHLLWNCRGGKGLDMEPEFNFKFNPLPMPRPKLRQSWHSMARAGEMVGERIIGTMVGHDLAWPIGSRSAIILPRGRVGFDRSVHEEHGLVWCESYWEPSAVLRLCCSRNFSQGLAYRQDLAGSAGNRGGSE